MPLLADGRRALLVGLAVTLLGCSYGPRPDRRSDFVVFFTGDQLEPDATARATLKRAVAAARATPELDVTVAGYEDASSAPEADQIRSRIRAQMVANALRADGIARDRIHLIPRRALGADPAVESLRVDIRIGS